MPEWIAKTSFDCVDSRRRRFRAVARVGAPDVVPRQGKLAEYSRCAVSLVPLVPERTIGGADTFQALCLAIEFLRTMLKAFTASGGQVLFPGTKSHIDLNNPSFCPWPDLAALRKKTSRPVKRKRKR